MGEGTGARGTHRNRNSRVTFKQAHSGVNPPPTRTLPFASAVQLDNGEGGGRRPWGGPKRNKSVAGARRSPCDRFKEGTRSSASSLELAICPSQNGRTLAKGALPKWRRSISGETCPALRFGNRHFILPMAYFSMRMTAPVKQLFDLPYYEKGSFHSKRLPWKSP